MQSNAATDTLAKSLLQAVFMGLLDVVRICWPYLAIALGIVILRLVWRRFVTNWIFDFRNVQLVNRARTFKDLMVMGPIQFEHLCRMLFEKQGYAVQVTRSTNDGGVDIVGRKSDECIIAQCKRYTKHTVGRPALQQFYGTFEDEGADHGFFITTSRFSKPAIEFARTKRITLVDGEQLALWINRYTSGQIGDEPVPDAPIHVQRTPSQSAHQKHSAICADCGRETQLPFEPNKGKPVFCRKCYVARRACAR